MRTFFIKVPKAGNTEPVDPTAQILEAFGIKTDDLENIKAGKVALPDFVTAKTAQYEKAAESRIKAEFDRGERSKAIIGAYKQVETKLESTAKELGIDPAEVWKDAPENERIDRMTKAFADHFGKTVEQYKADMAKQDRGAEVTQLKELLGTANGKLTEAQKAHKEVLERLESEKQAIRDEVELDRHLTTVYDKLKARLLSEDKSDFEILLKSKMAMNGYVLKIERDENNRTTVRPTTKEGAGIQIVGKTDNHTLETLSEALLDSIIRKSNVEQTGGGAASASGRIDANTAQKLAKETGVADAFFSY